MDFEYYNNPSCCTCHLNRRTFLSLVRRICGEQSIACEETRILVVVQDPIENSEAVQFPALTCYLIFRNRSQL